MSRTRCQGAARSGRGTEQGPGQGGCCRRDWEAQWAAARAHPVCLENPLGDSEPREPRETSALPRCGGVCCWEKHPHHKGQCPFSVSASRSVVSDSLQPDGLQPGSSVQGTSQARTLE